MARMCDNSKLLELYKNKNEPFAKFDFKLQYLPTIPSEDHTEKVFKEKLLNQSTDPQTLSPFLKKETLRFRCHFEENKRKAEIRRKKFIQKLKRVYRINLENLSENSTNEIIRKVKVMEKEKREKEKKTAENTIKMINRLLEEQKYKRRGINIKVSQKRKKPKIISLSKESSLSLLGNDWCKVAEEYTPEEEEEVVKLSDALNQKGIYSKKLTLDQTRIFPKQAVKAIDKGKVSQKKEKEYEDEYSEGIFNNFEPKIDIAKCCLWPRSEKPVPLEKSLQSDPKTVIFQDYKKGKTYFKTVRITNIGKETIHCRYMGILVHVKAEERLPIGVSVRDNTKLRPGFSCSTKIRLCSQNDTNEQECSIIYETRRQNKPLQHSCFFVPVKCMPARAVIKISPLKIRFPSMTWCSTKRPEDLKLLTKIIKIENMGAKGCSCKIVKQIVENEEKEMFEGEGDWIAETSSTESEVSKRNFFHSSKEYTGEENFFLEPDKLNMIKNIINELLENVFAIFRFSKKYYIEVGPFSTVEVEVKFIPEYQGLHQEKHVIELRDCYSPIQEIIEITGDIKKLPLRAEPEVIDLKICIANSGVYSAKFQIYNYSKVSFLVSLKVPKTMKKHAHVYPRSTIIQAMNYCDFSVKIYPRLSLIKDSGQCFNEASGILEFPIFVHPSNFNSCKSDFMKIYVFALITDYALELSPPNIDFGTVSTLETFRTKILLRNHSLAAQEYGFLNLPKEVRIEPNMGFGWILPKESIPLYILFSPGVDLTRDSKDKTNAYFFQVKVTSIAECGGFREKFPEEEKTKICEDAGGNYYEDYFETNGENLYPEDEVNTTEEKESRKFEECKEYDSSLEGEESNEKLQKLETEIRNFLRKDGGNKSEYSFFNKFNTTNHDEDLRASKNGQDFTEAEKTEIGDEEEEDEEDEDDEDDEEGEQEKGEEFLKSIHSERKNNSIICRAVIIEPYCQMSESIIQLPATPYSSVSIYRFRLNGFNESLDYNCTCGTHMSKSFKPCKGQPKFEAAFQFQYSSPHFTLEPQSGYLKAGESVPINVVYKPKFPAENDEKESIIQTTMKEKSMEGKVSLANSASNSQTKTQKVSIRNPKKSSDLKSRNDVTNASIRKPYKYDSFAGGEGNLRHLIEPFVEEVKINCIIKIIGKNDQKGRTEIHDMILVCPCIKPNFAYLGNSHEINFGKVFVGSKSRMLIEAQNISLKRISPTISLFNPIGSFFSAAFLKRLEVDPEHVWYYPLVYVPKEAKGIEKEFFEIQCESTNIFLMTRGEAIEPQCKIMPAMNCHLLESIPGNYEEIKIDIENLSSVNLPLLFITEFVKEGFDNDVENKKESQSESIKKEKYSTSQNEGRKRKKGESERKKSTCWEEVPEGILLMLENFQEVDDDRRPNIFSLTGVDGDQKVDVPASSKSTVKIRYSPPVTEEKEKPSLIKKQAAKYKIMLEGSDKLFKEITIIGAVSKYK